MRTRFFAAALLVAASLAATLAGASAARAVRPLGLHALRPNAVVPNATITPNVYFAVDPDSGASGLYADTQSGNNLWELAGLSTWGMAVDATGNLYVGTDAYPQGIYVFPPAQSGLPKPVRFLDDRGFDPTGIAVEANGTVLVANACLDTIGFMLDCTASGNVVAYRKGAARPSLTYEYPNGYALYNVFYVTADHEGNVYASTTSGLGVFQWANPKHVRTLPLDSYWPTGLATDAADNLVVADRAPATSSSVEVFAHGSWQILRKFGSGMGPSGVQNISLDQSNTYLYAATNEPCTPSGPPQPAIHIFNYASGTSAGCFNVVGTYAVAANPEAIP